MRPQDKSAFCSAAKVFDAWILVRERRKLPKQIPLDSS